MLLSRLTGLLRAMPCHVLGEVGLRREPSQKFTPELLTLLRDHLVAALHALLIGTVRRDDGAAVP